MSTSDTGDPNQVRAVVAGPAAVTGAGAGPLDSFPLPLDALTRALAGELARLANDTGKRGPALAPSPVADAFNVGGGGLSPGAPEHPPGPGVAWPPSPKESDLRSLPAAASPVTGVAPVALASAPVPDSGSPAAVPPLTGLPSVAGVAPAPVAPVPQTIPGGGIAGVPYFLQIAGMPSPAGPATPPPWPTTGAVPPVPPDGVAPEAAASEAGVSPRLEAFSPVLEETAAPATPSRGIFDAASIKQDFPILAERVHGRRLVWLDNAATTQKPRAVIDRLATYYEHENSNVHRAAHALAARATDAYEGARDKVRRFLKAPSAQEIVFVRGATEAINLVAKSWGYRHVGPGDEILITWLEHHANIVPWQQLCAEKGARLCVAPVDSSGQVILEEFERLLSGRTRLVSITQVSNALGTITPAEEMTKMAHRRGARVLIDGAQAVSHMPVDVQALDCDFYCFSGHKVFAPTGIGALFGKSEVLADMPPWQGGGNMIRDVTFEKTTYQAPPWRFEAGTGNIADAAGLGAAIDYVEAIGMENIARYEHELLGYATSQLSRVRGLRLLGTAAEKAGVLSFLLAGHRPEDVGAALDREGIAVRAGHHCAQPILRRFGVESTVRASLAPYNTPEDIDALCLALARLQAGAFAP